MYKRQAIHRSLRAHPFATASDCCASAWRGLTFVSNPWAARQSRVFSVWLSIGPRFVGRYSSAAHPSAPPLVVRLPPGRCHHMMFVMPDDSSVTSNWLRCLSAFDQQAVCSCAAQEHCCLLDTDVAHAWAYFHNGWRFERCGWTFASTCVGILCGNLRAPIDINMEAAWALNVVHWQQGDLC